MAHLPPRQPHPCYSWTAGYRQTRRENSNRSDLVFTEERCEPRAESVHWPVQVSCVWISVHRAFAKSSRWVVICPTSRLLYYPCWKPNIQQSSKLKSFTVGLLQSHSTLLLFPGPLLFTRRVGTEALQTAWFPVTVHKINKTFLQLLVVLLNNAVVIMI